MNLLSRSLTRDSNTMTLNPRLWPYGGSPSALSEDPLQRYEIESLWDRLQLRPAERKHRSDKWKRSSSLPHFHYRLSRWYKVGYEMIQGGMNQDSLKELRLCDLRGIKWHQRVPCYKSSPSSVLKWSKTRRELVSPQKNAVDKNHIVKRVVAPVTTSWW